jgi:hypothetical protein
MAKRKKRSTKTTKTKASYLVAAVILVLAFIFLAGYMNPPKVPVVPTTEPVITPTDPVFAKICTADTNTEKNFYSCTDNDIGIKYVDRQTSAPTTYYDKLGRRIQDCGGTGRPLAIGCLNLQAAGSIACTQKVSCP